MSSLVALLCGGCGNKCEGHQIFNRVTKLMSSGSSQESCTKEGNSPVFERLMSLIRHPSSAGSGKAGVNLSRPLDKAKYS